MGERGEPGAEIVEGEAAARVGELPGEEARGVQAADRGRLGDLQAEPLRLDLGHLELIEDPAAELGVVQRAGRDVDLEAEALRAGPRSGQRGDRPLHHPPVDPQHEVGALGGGQELGGPQVGLSPSRRRMSSSWRPVRPVARSTIGWASRLIVPSSSAATTRCSTDTRRAASSYWPGVNSRARLRPTRFAS